jgi:glycine/D-amino acid oxidase-like deaminating enzyme
MIGLDPSSQPSYWLQRNPSPPRPLLRGTVTADLVVLGGGMTGLATALRLAEDGHNVAVIEAGTVGCAATARNVGFILEGVAESYPRTVTLWGHARAKAARRLSVENHDRIAARVAEFAIACGYARSGSLHLAGSDLEAEELITGTPLLQADGFAAELVPHGALPTWAQRAGYRCGQIVPGDGELDPVAFAVGLARAAEQRGVTIFERSDGRIDERPDGVSVITPNGRVDAAAAVIATNGYAGRVSAWLGARIDPVRGQVLATGPLGLRLFDLPIYASHGYEYWRQLDSGEVILGGWRNLDADAEVGLDHRLHDGIQAKMEAFLRSVDPALAEAPITGRWSGIMGFSRDGLPIVGPLPGSPLVYAAAGFTGHGFGFAMRAADVVAELIATGTSAWAELLSPRRLA